MAFTMLSLHEDIKAGKFAASDNFSPLSFFSLLAILKVMEHITENIKGIKAAIEKAKSDRNIAPTVSAVLQDGTLVEMVYRREERRTLLCTSKEGQVRYEPSIVDDGKKLAPYSPENNLLKNDVVLFPSEAAEYESEQALVAEIRQFIHRYVDVTPLFEEITSYYILFTWLYDAFNELPYLRLRGDTGSGKTRFLQTAGALVYKPIYASGASTVSPLFRILDNIRGTLIIDEGDFRFSDEKAEIVKILNNGNARGFPVLRSESVNHREFSPRAYAVFGPKFVSTRGFFQDRALESRCITEETGGRVLRDDIPLNLPDEFKRESLAIRNKLLMFRFRNFRRRAIDPTLVDRTIEPRLSQIFVPLMSVIEDSGARQALRLVAREYHRELVADRGMDLEAQVLEIIHDLQESPYTDVLSIKEITERLAERYGDDFERKVTPHWVGQVVRRRLQLKTERRRDGYVIAASERQKLSRLFERYGIADASGEPVNSVNSVNSTQEEKALSGSDDAVRGNNGSGVPEGTRLPD
jgi:hypothetical protein